MKKNKKRLRLKISKFTLLIFLLDIIVIDGLIVINNNKFKTFWIPTAMTTMSHKYLAYTLYNPATVNKVMSENYIETSSEQMNLDDIIIGDTGKKNYLILLNNSRDTGKDYMSMYDIRTMIGGNIDYTISRNYYIKNIDKYVMNGEILTLNKNINTFHSGDISNMKKLALDLIDDSHNKEVR